MYTFLKLLIRFNHYILFDKNKFFSSWKIKYVSSVANIDRRLMFWRANVHSHLRHCARTSLIARPTSHFQRYIQASGDEWIGTGSESYAMINEWPHGTSASPAHLDEADSHQPRMGERAIVSVRVWRPP